MRSIYRKWIGIIILCGLSIDLNTPLANEWSGVIGSELQLFPQTAIDQDQGYNLNLSLAFQLEYFHEWDEGRQSFAFIPFFRWDQHDPERTHVDIRELTWLFASDIWELRIGFRKVFWGVTEAVHLVDIINQTDLVENINSEEKLGQPMVNLALINDWGTVDFFLMSGFRERTFPGKSGRLRFQPYVDADRAEYDSAAKQGHIDLAVRWFHSIDNWDIGLSHFFGTGRDPILRLGLDQGGSPILIPRYEIIHQTSLDVQTLTEDWLWKLEALYRNGRVQKFFAATGGFEYTFYGLFDTAWDLGVIGEYVYDGRPLNVPTPFNNDFIAGVRLALNDEQSTEILASASFDVNNGAKFFNLEASRRIGENWKADLEARLFVTPPPSDPFYSLRKDSYLQFTLSRYF